MIAVMFDRVEAKDEKTESEILCFDCLASRHGTEHAKEAWYNLVDIADVYCQKGQVVGISSNQLMNSKTHTNTGMSYPPNMMDI